jgi:hypothetical protein
MTDLPPCRDSNDDTGEVTLMSPDSGSTTGAPRWVMVFGIVALALVLLFVILHLTGSGLGAHTPPFNVTEHGGQQQRP